MEESEVVCGAVVVVLEGGRLDTQEQTAKAEVSTCNPIEIPQFERTQVAARPEMTLAAEELH